MPSDGKFGPLKYIRIPPVTKIKFQRTAEKNRNIWYRLLSELERQVRMCFDWTGGTFENLPRNTWRDKWPGATGVVLPHRGLKGVWEGAKDSQQPENRLLKINQDSVQNHMQQ